MNKLGLIAIAGALMMSGCAAMFHGTSAQVSIRSNEDDAKIYVNEAYIGKSNGVTTLQKSQNYVIRVSKEGCEDVSIPVARSFDATTLLGVLIDFGVFTTLIIDGVGTGAWQNFPQTSYVLDPLCKS